MTNITNMTVDQRIERFIAKKAIQYPRIGLMPEPTLITESALKPLHEVMAGKLISGRGKRIVSYLNGLVKAYSASTYSRTHFVK